MFTCSPNLTHSFHTVCKTIRFKVGKNSFFPSIQGIQQSFGGQKSHSLRVGMD
jgi:hypothetical protein